MGPRLVFVGAATLDTIALVDRFPEPDERQVAEDLVTAGGGPAATAAVAARRLGETVGLVAAVGHDRDGDRVLDDLAAEGVDVTTAVRVPDTRTAASVVLVDRTLGSRAICNRPGPGLRIGAGSPAEQLIAEAEWVHVDHVGWAAVGPLLARLGTRRPRLSVDGGNPIRGFSAAGVDLYAPTLDALARRYGHDDPDARLDPDALLDAALREGATWVVATLGAGGALAASADGDRVAVPGYRVDVVSTLGAGDVFHGALVAAAAREQPFDTRITYATIAAALSCRGLDGRSAIPTHEEVVNLLDQRFTPPIRSTA